jgi:hypothetical protein
MGAPGGQDKNVFCHYLGVTVKKEQRTCHGVKICQYAHSDLKKMRHKSVDFDSDLSKRISEEVSSNNVENNTFA